jgi:hypothetical protein
MMVKSKVWCWICCMKKSQWSRGSSLKVISHMLHVKYIYLQNWAIYGVNVGKYLSTMEHMGIIPLPILDSPWIFGSVSTPIWNKLNCTKLSSTWFPQWKSTVTRLHLLLHHRLVTLVLPIYCRRIPQVAYGKHQR